MEKPWYLSKTMWAALILLLIAIYQVIIQGEINILVLEKVALALGFVGLRMALPFKLKK